MAWIAGGSICCLWATLTTEPATEADWEAAMREAKRRLGLEGNNVPRAAHLTLPARAAEELRVATTD